MVLKMKYLLLLIFLIFAGCKGKHSQLELNDAQSKLDDYIKNNYNENKIVTDAFLGLNLRENKDSICLKINNLFENKIVFAEIYSQYLYGAKFYLRSLKYLRIVLDQLGLNIIFKHLMAKLRLMFN